MFCYGRTSKSSWEFSYPSFDLLLINCGDAGGFFASAPAHTCIRDVLEGGLQLIGVFCDGNWVSGFASFNPHTPVWLITRGHFHHHHSPLEGLDNFELCCIFARRFTTLHVHSRSFPFHKVVKTETEAACGDLTFLHNGSKCENKEIYKNIKKQHICNGLTQLAVSSQWVQI